jgi:hypothetical protein
MYVSLVYDEPLSVLGSAFSVALIAFELLPTMKAPTAAPPIMSSSIGWNSALR